MRKLKGLLLAFSMAAIVWIPALAEEDGESNAPVANSGVSKPGNGVATFLGGTSVPDGGVAMVLNYNFFSTTNAQGRTYRNVFAPVLRVGIGNAWDIAVQVPMTFTIQDGKRNTTNPVGSGVNGRTLVWFHKQHLAKKFENSSLMVATNYSLSIPTSSGMNGFWGFGFGVGLTWDYLSMRGVFDIQATANTKGADANKGASPLTLWIKAGYHYAFNNYVYAGLELNWDSSIYSSLYNGYNGSGSHNVYLGPILSFKIPELNGSAWGVGFFWDVANQYQATQKVKWKEAWRLTSRITASF